MARREVTSPAHDVRQHRRRTQAEKEAVERTMRASAEAVSDLVKPDPPPPRLALNILEFCAAFRISEDFYYKLKRQGQGPREMKVGARTLISLAAADEWRIVRAVGHGFAGHRQAELNGHGRHLAQTCCQPSSLISSLCRSPRAPSLRYLVKLAQKGPPTGAIALANFVLLT